MNSQYDKLNDMFVDIQNILFDLVGENGYIKYNAWNKGISLTDREKERVDKINEQISNLEECAEYIESAMGCLEEYID